MKFPYFLEKLENITTIRRKIEKSKSNLSLFLVSPNKNSGKTLGNLTQVLFFK